MGHPLACVMSPAPAIDRTKLLITGSGAIVATYVAVLASLFARHLWIADAKGHPLLTDFVEVWVAGALTLHGSPAAPYDWRLHHAAQVAAMGHDFKGFLGWHYPPPFLFIAAALALLPYTAAFLVWVCSTVVFYAAVIWRIAKRFEAALVALTAPAALGCALVGQNGFFTASLIGAALLALENNPVIGGVFVGLLTYKPQFGLLFPVALLASGNWRAIASASATALAMLMISTLAFGVGPFAGFLGFLPQTASSVLGEGAAGFQKLQSVYGLMRWIGANEMFAWCAQGGIMIAAVIGVFELWRHDTPYAAKAAALATATILATPYAYMYDFPLLAVAFAFLYRERAFNRVEAMVAAATLLAMLPFMRVAAPIGPLLALLPALLIVRRLVPSQSPAMVPQGA